MNDLFYSVPTMVCCALGYYFSWRYYSKRNFPVAVLLVIICGLALRVYTASDFFLHNWDERYHALVAKNLMHHPLLPTLYERPVLPFDYTDWTANHIWLHKQPLPLWAMASSMHLFGVNEIALRLPCIALSTLAIWLTYFVGSYFFDKKTGYLAAFFFSINGLIIELTAGRIATDHIDIFFLFFVELAIVFTILFAQKQKAVYNILAGVSIGAAILSKWLPALIVVPVWLLIVTDSGKFTAKKIFFQLLILLSACTLIFLPWQLYIYHTFPAEAHCEAAYNLKHITEGLAGQTGPFYYFIDKIRINYGELIYLPLLWFFWKTLSHLSDRKHLALAIWIAVPLLFFSVVKTKMQGYILFISPALFVITAEFFFALYDYKLQRQFKWIASIILLMLIALPVRYMIERVKPFNGGERNLAWVTDLRKLGERKIAHGLLFNYSRPVEAMFYTELTAYPNIPDSNKIGELMSAGYAIVVNDDGKIPEQIKIMNGVEIERLR